ncbi:hypothetical protein BOX15_Mlig015591g3 [Macrostomum lignano]|uniref:Multidrug and toxin extrusion protein n=1 Tax=Macrostomum lignano TaxID=282301 RepID=A0A267DC31_9PLAT|nr:hypothetical protein BOX15_Mlig015591g3 [Macrostomum lignano]
MAELCTSFRRFFNNDLKQEIKKLLTIAWPVVATYFLNFVILSESIIMCGRLGKLELDGAALANSIINGFGLSFGSGLVAACDTLFSQCYGSAYKKRVGLYLQQSILIIGLAPFLIWPFYFNIEPILIALGQDAEVSRMSANYVLYFSPGIFFYYMYLIQARYLQNQDKVIVPMIVALIANAFNILSQYLGIYVWNFGFLCSPVCQCLTYALMAGTMLAYILISRVYRETWNGWSLQCLFNWWQFLRLALPGMGMVCLEIICYEIGTFIAGIIGTSELGAQSILFQTETLAYTCVLGFGVAVNIRVGQNLGANNGPGARLAWIAGICCLLCVASVLCAVFVVGKDFIPGLYTTDPDVLTITAQIFPLLGFFIFLDGLQSVCAGALRGCGRQLTGVIFVFLSYYGLGMTIGLPLALATDLHVIGLWVGLLIGVSLICPAYIAVLARQDWRGQARQAQRRVRAASEKQLRYDTDCEEERQQGEDDQLANETTGLLTDRNHRPYEQNQESSPEKQQQHRRYPSNPAYTTADQLVPIRTPSEIPSSLSNAATRRIIYIRLATGIAVIGIFSIGLIIRLTINSNNDQPPSPGGNSSWSNVTYF